MVEKLVWNFDKDGQAAAEFALKLVNSHYKSKFTKYLTNGVPMSEKSEYSMDGSHVKTVLVFDIDDTLITSKKQPLREIVKLFKDVQTKLPKSETYIVTARLNDPGYKLETMEELKKIGVTGFKDLVHAPPKFRKNLGDVAIWKQRERIFSSEDSMAPYVTLTVGDQWGDILSSVKTENDIRKLDNKYGSKNYMIFRSNDNVSLWGFKLPSN